MSQTYSKDTTTFQNGSTFDIPLTIPRTSIPAIPGGRKPMAVINNETGVSLNLTLAGGRNFSLAAGAWTKPFAIYFSDVNLHGIVQNVLPNSPVNTFSITVYGPNEDPIQPIALGNSPIGISGNVQTSNVQSLTNDGSAPETTVIEMTPSDQAQSSIVERNTGSGFRQILSAGVLRTIWNFVRGNATTGKASIQFGDSGDPTISSYYGSILGGQPATLGAVTAGNVTLGLNDIISTSQDTTAQNRSFLVTSDAHSGKAWSFFQMQDGSILAQETSGGNFVFRIFPDGHMTLLGAISTDNGQVASTGVGELVLNRTAPNSSATDTFVIQRSGSFGTGSFAFGVDQNGRLYCFDGGRSGFLFAGASFETGSVSGGLLFESRSAGGGSAGAIGWGGTTDPAGNAGEGDIWWGA